tara:strand:- start:984 stop:1784 length:801 start_codon:yes stop_codon:yes gene_type:complete
MGQNYKYIKLIPYVLHDQAQYLDIVLDRPKKRNALNPVMISEITSVLDKYEKNLEIKLILISSSSSVFCAGADLQYLKKLQKYSYQENLNDSKNLMNLYKKMLKYPKLIISKVCGPAIAGGCGIITASDMVFATNTSKFGYPEIKLGFIPALVSTFLYNKIREVDLRDLLLTGKIVTAIQAKEIGLINQIYSVNKIDNAVVKFIKKIVQETSPNSIKETKKMLYKLMNVNNKLQKAAELNAKNRQSDDFKKGISNFLDKQPTNWLK